MAQVEPRAVPDALWAPIERRNARYCLLLKLATWSNVLTVVGVIFCSKDHVWRFVLPFMLAAMLTGAGGIAGGRRNLKRARQLMIEYHGCDPGPPP